MSDAADSGDIIESFVEDENKVNIEATTINLDCVKSEPNEEALEFEEESYTTRYRIALKYEDIYGESSFQTKIEQNYDNLIGFLDNDVIMEKAMIKSEAIKEENDGAFTNFHCSKCMGIYEGYCLKCSTVSCILNNNLDLVKSESNTIPTDILEIRESTKGKGVYLLRTLPMNVIFGPFEGVLGIESTVGRSWKIVNNKLKNTKFGNWMKNIGCASNVSLKNLEIFQIDGNLYFQTNREIAEGEELLVYYDNEELQQLVNSEGCLYTPQKQEKLPEIFACSVCCLGFGSNNCLMEHKRKYCRMPNSRNTKDFVLVKCFYCKMWMEKREHEEYHVVHCLEKHQRKGSGYSEAVDRSDIEVEEMKNGCNTKEDKRRYQRDISSRPYDQRDDLEFDTKDYQCFSGANREMHLNEYVLAGSSKNEQIQNAIETNNKSHFEKKHRGIKAITCHICMMKFTSKCSLNVHIKAKHRDDESAKDYKCSECSFQTNYKSNLQQHLNKHRGITFKCDICTKEFSQKYDLKTHIKNKHRDAESTKDYKCSECLYQTNYKHNFQTHLNKHRGIGFHCNICMMKFTQKSSLKSHIANKHTNAENVKDYKCSECSYRTNSKADLHKHLNQHRGVKPFKCDICMKKFTQKGNLTVHMKNKHTDNGSVKEYKCSECSFQTIYKNALKMHINKHRGIGFTCEICMMKYTQRSNLTKHIQKKHCNDGSA